MKVLLKNLLMLVAAAPLAVGCAKATFSEMKTSGLENSGNIEQPGPVKTPPTIVWVQVPGSQLVNEPVTVVYEIIPGSAPVVSIVCNVDGKPVPCSIDGDTLVINNPTLGDHNLEIIVTDAQNQQVQDDVEWTLLQGFKPASTPVTVVAKQGPVDVVFIIDNSKSMREEQLSMAQKISNFIDRVDGLDWKIGIITTDTVNGVKGDGRFLKFGNSNYSLTSQLSKEDARKLFSATVQTGVEGHHIEQGIRNLYRSLERAVNPVQNNATYKDSVNKAFFRKDAALAAIVVSDENEDVSQTPANLSYLNKGSELVKFVNKTWGAEKLFQFHSIIVRPGDTKCKNIDPDVHGYGTAYAELSGLTSGILGDICAPDYGNQLTVIGQEIANLQKTYDLSCKPQDTNNDGVADIRIVSVKPGTAVPSFTVEGQQIIFTTPLLQGNYSIEYFCPN